MDFSTFSSDSLHIQSLRSFIAFTHDMFILKCYEQCLLHHAVLCTVVLMNCTSESR